MGLTVKVDSSTNRSELRGARVEEQLARRGGWQELLRLPAALFGVAAGVRGALYDRGLLPMARVAAPVISIGNLTVGGTGKTPMVLHLARELQRRGLVPGVCSRGYGRKSPAELNDEGRELALAFPGLAQEQDADRIAGAGRLVERQVDVVLLDDAFQHRRLQRDLDIVLIDATRPWGLGPPPGGGAPLRAFLPRGLLREAPRALRRAHLIVLTRTDAVREHELEALREELAELVPGMPIAEAVHCPVGLRTQNERLDLGRLRGTQVDLLSAIGNPAAFEGSLLALGASIGEHRRFPDHHAYSAGDLEGLGERPLVTTAKDWVKLEGLCPHPALQPWVLEVELRLNSGGPVLGALLDSLSCAPRRREREALHAGLHG